MTDLLMLPVSLPHLSLDTTIVCVNEPVPVPPDSSVSERRHKDREERMSLVLWRRPMVTLNYFLLETLITLKDWTLK